ncbi:MAG TPA: flagellin [Bryobacteraceae bacterium]|jgi:flagellar hook-associated protein 3 FlgL|nr:flagellin [Bryobacteraceae bacterium]
MITSLNPINQEFIDNLNRVIDRLNTDQLDISSGVRMRQVSNSPDQVSSLLQARAALSASQQISTNLGNVKTEVDTSEQALEGVVQLFDQVQTIGAQGATGTQTAAARATLATQLQSLEQQFVGAANTSIEGRFLFSGDADQTAAYTYDVTQANPVSAYLGSASTRVALHPNGTTFPVALTAQQIFDSSDPTTNVFGAINGLVTALNNNDQTAIQTSVNGLGKVAEYLNQQLAFYGNTQNQVAAATNYAQTQQVGIQAQIGNLQDTDMTAAILDLTQAQTQMQASLQSRGQIPKTTLFDFLA